MKPVASLVGALGAMVVGVSAQAQRVVTGGSFTAGANVLFSTDFSQDPVGSFPSGLKFVRGPLDVVLVDGVPMLRAIGEAEFQIPLGQPLPQDFTLEFDLIPKAGNGDDLNIEGGPVASRSVSSAEIRFNHQIASIMGGGQGMSQVTLPYDLQTELINQRSIVQLAMNGTQFKLFVNGRQIYNIPNLMFRRAAALRVFVGGRDDATNAVYIARISLATNTPGLVASSATGLSGNTTPAPNVTAVGNNRPATPAQTAAVTPPASRAPGTGTIVAGGPATRPAPPVLSGGPAPTGLAVTGTPTTATVQWGAVPGATHYLVNRAVMGTTNWTAVTPTPITTTTSPVDALPNWTQTYTYQVLAYQANGTFGAAMINYTPPQPADPTGLVATVVPKAGVQLSWQPAPGVSLYLVSGPGITPSATTAATTFSVPAAPYGTIVYQVASVFQPGGVLTPQASWPSVTVTNPLASGPVSGTGTTSPPPSSTPACACTKTGPFAAPGLNPIDAGGLTSSFTHPTAGLFTVTAQSVGGRVMLDITDSQGKSVLSANNPPAWGLSPDFAYFAVAATPASANAGAVITVYKVGLGPWPIVLSTMAYPDGRWGFSADGGMFIVTRLQNVPVQFSVEAYNLAASHPKSAVLQVTEPNVYGPTVTTSPCGDRLMYFRWTQLPPQPQVGEAEFYRRTTFGGILGRLLTDWDGLAGTTRTADVVAGTGSSSFMVALNGLKLRSGGQTSFTSLQCSP